MLHAHATRDVCFLVSRCTKGILAAKPKEAKEAKQAKEPP
jgi:hypothetical protein